MIPYAQVPLALSHDPRVTSLLPVVELLLYRLYLRAAACSATRDTIPLPRGVAYTVAVRAIVGEHVDRLDALVTAGLVVYEADTLRLTLTAGAPAASSAATRDAPSMPPPGIVPGKPSESPVAQRARNDRALFKGRAKGTWARIPRELTWEQWITTDEGEQHVADREVDFPGYRAWVTPRVTPSGNAVPTKGSGMGNTPGNAAGNAPLSASLNPSFTGEEKKEEREGNAGNTPRVTAQGNTPGVTLLEALRDASAGRATLTGALAIELELSRLLERHALSADEIAAAGRAFEDPARWWPKGKHAAPRHVTLNDLAGFRGESGYEWRALAALVSHVRSVPRAAPAPAAPSKPAPVKALPIAEVNRIAREAAEKSRAQRALRPIENEVQHG